MTLQKKEKKDQKRRPVGTGDKLPAGRRAGYGGNLQIISYTIGKIHTSLI